jgi:dodecin
MACIAAKFYGILTVAPCDRRSLSLPAPRALPIEGSIMTVAKIIEINASSTSGIEDAVRNGLKKCSESVKNIKGAWVNETKVVTDDQGNVTEWRVNMKVSFVVD